jgi:2-oxoglutarate ferredoxin oxidoreductase subunit gamma
MSNLELQFAGFGGQGVILAGMTVGRALVLYQGQHATLTQSFGPEARGSACSCQMVVAPDAILYPYLTRPHILVALSQEACRKFAPKVRPDGLLILEEDLVRPEGEIACAGIFCVPALRLAEELGRRLVLNMVLVGYFTAVTQQLPEAWGFPSPLLSTESARRAVAESVPAGTQALNLAAFDKGFAAGEAAVARGKEAKPVTV